jgi:hypothetical protein
MRVVCHCIKKVKETKVQLEQLKYKKNMEPKDTLPAGTAVPDSYIIEIPDQPRPKP